MHNREISHIVKTEAQLKKTEGLGPNVIWEKFISKLKHQQSFFYENTMQKIDWRL